MPAGRPAGDATEARRWLDQAKGTADSAQAAATIAQTHALLALNDRAGALVDSLARRPGVRTPLQDAEDEAAISRAIARGSIETDQVLRFVRDELQVTLEPFQEQMLRRLVTASVKEHPLQAADRAWFEAQKRNAIARQDPQGIRESVDGLNRARTAEQYDTSQYADAPTEMERTWASEQEIAEVQAAEAQVDPDIAATNAARRREERERAAMDRQVRRGTGVFGQMGPSEEDA